MSQCDPYSAATSTSIFCLLNLGLSAFLNLFSTGPIMCCVISSIVTVLNPVLTPAGTASTKYGFNPPAQNIKTAFSINPDICALLNCSLVLAVLKVSPSSYTNPPSNQKPRFWFGFFGQCLRADFCATVSGQTVAVVTTRNAQLSPIFAERFRDRINSFNLYWKELSKASLNNLLNKILDKNNSIFLNHTLVSHFKEYLVKRAAIKATKKINFRFFEKWTHQYLITVWKFHFRYRCLQTWLWLIEKDLILLIYS